MGCCLSSRKSAAMSGGPRGSGGAGEAEINETSFNQRAAGDDSSPRRPSGPQSGAPSHLQASEDTAATNVVSPHAIQVAIAKGKKIVRGMYDYVSANETNADSIPDLNFSKGDIMEVTKEDGDWWLARNMLTGQEGYIPNTYVALENSLDQFDWFHGKISRKDAEKQLQLPGNIRGTFIVRESESSTGAYSLSILEEDEQTHARTVKHYRIRDLDSGGCYITTKIKCLSLHELVAYYTEQPDGLCSKLTRACARSKPVMYDLSRNARDKWEIERSSIDFKERLGAGNFGEVYKGLWNKHTPVAIKTLKEGMMEVSKFLEEAAIMKRLRHPKLVNLYAVCSREQPIYIITEFMSNGSLLQFLREDKHHSLGMSTLIDMAAQIADGMQYIEEQSYIHRDLAARNILVGENYLVKIGDFGLARVITEEQYEATQGSKFPIKWTAPEAAMYGKFTIKSDVWAYGILLIELVTYGATPYPGMTNSEVLQQLERSYRHPKPLGCPDDMYDIMLTCWRHQPHDRPTFDHLFHTMDDFTVATQSGYAETNP